VHFPQSQPLSWAAVTLLCALPIYVQVAGRSHAGLGSIAMLENLLPGWWGKFMVLVLLGFATTDFVHERQEYHPTRRRKRQRLTSNGPIESARRSTSVHTPSFSRQALPIEFYRFRPTNGMVRQKVPSRCPAARSQSVPPRSSRHRPILIGQTLALFI
jgi:hypothetical protein